MIRKLRSITNTTVNKEPKWRHNRDELTTGYDRAWSVEGEPRWPYARRVTPEAGKVVDMSWDPITRIVGNLGIYTKIDFDNREVVSCKATSSLFRGYSVFMKGKDPRDAHFITSRICGICGDNHAVCSCYAQQMAYGVKPPPLAEWIVNLGEAAEYIFDHIIFQDNLVFVDFCEQMVKETNPSVLAKAEKTAARGADVHGYRTIADIMRSYNPFTGRDVPRGAAHEPDRAGDDLPDGGAPRAPLHDLSRRGRDGGDADAA